MTTSAEMSEGPTSGRLSQTGKSRSILDRGSDDHSPLTLKPSQLLFAGRVGGNQSFILNRDDPAQAALLQKTPDAAPFMSLGETFDLGGLRDLDLWKAAFIEGIGECFSSVRGISLRPHRT